MVNEQLLQLIDPCVRKYAAHVLDVVLRGRHQRPIVEVFVDTENGVTTELCSDISREIAAAMDKKPILPPSYELIVSSPGIDRPLKFTWQYKQHIGRDLLVKYQHDNVVVEQSGTLSALDESGLVIQAKKNKEPLHIEFASIAEARVKAPW